MGKDLNKAREIYYNYGQSGFHMMREGVLSEYQSYNISKQQEKLWTNEYLDRALDELDINDHDSFFGLFNIVDTHRRFDFLPAILKKIDNDKFNSLNPYSSISLAQKLFFLIFEATRKLIPISKDLKQQVLKTIESLLVRTKEVELPKDFKIPNFGIIAIEQKITQEQYLQRKIIVLEYDLIKAKMLE